MTSHSYRDDADLFPEICSSMIESPRLFPGMDGRLYRAAEQGFVLKLNRLIAEELNILHEFTALGNSSLHIAVSRGNLRFIKKLLEEVKTDLDAGREFVRAKNSDGNSALHLAALYGHYELVEEFLSLMGGDEEAGNFLKFQNEEGNTALHEAAKGGNYKVVEALLRHSRGGDDLIGLRNNAGETALFVACQSGHTKIVERLLSCMTHNSSNMKRRDGQTPLHAAVLYCHTDVVEKLVQHSPEMAKETDGCGRTAMHMLVLSSPIPGFLGRDWTHVHDLNKIFKLLLKRDNSLCYRRNNKKQTPAHMAVEWEQYHIISLILKSSRDSIEVVDSEGRKPLHLAIINAVRSTGTTNISRLYSFKSTLLSLMSRDSINHCDNIGRTALHIALENIETDRALYKTIIHELRIRGALLTSEILEDKRRLELSSSKTRIKGQNISINAVLIATVSFAAAFTLPGGLTQADEDKKAVLIKAPLFKVFLICDAFSFCTSIASAVLVQHAGKGDQRHQPRVVYSLYLLWSALLSLLVAFGAAVHLVIAPSPWLAGIVWTMVCLAPLVIHVLRLRSKFYIFYPERYKIWPAVSFPYFMIVAILHAILYIMGDILNVLLFTGLFYNVVHWIRKLLKRRR